MGTVALAASTVGVMGLSAPAQAADSVVIGISGDVGGVQAKTSLPRHFYGKLSGPAKVGALVNIESTTSWSKVANGSQDANVKRWAKALKGKNVMVSFSHEPMAKQNLHMGNAASFIAAWKHVVNVFNQQGSTSVKWTWNVTSHSFRIKSGSSEYGAKWYPGDAYVDYVAGESYNRVGCGGKDTSFASQIKEIFAFANQHHKKFVAAEFASNKYSGRAGWINAAHSYIGSHKGQFAGAFYYNPTHSMCNWHLSTSAEKSAFLNMANGL